MIFTCRLLASHLRLSNAEADQPRNDKLNYYKFGLGLGAVSAGPPTGDGKKGGAEASEAAAGGADQYIPYYKQKRAQADTQAHYY